MWNFVHASVAGTAHVARGAPCQDASGAAWVTTGGEAVLLLVLSDGAGSARHAEAGSAFVAQNWLKVTADILTQKAEADEAVLREIADTVRENLATHVAQAEGRVEDYACTLLGAALYPGHGLFFQVGDGAWVCQAGGDFHCPTWPTQGEYAGETVFLTSPRGAENYQTARMDKIRAVAGFTDGIERLALKLAEREPSAAFFAPLLAGVAALPKPQAEEELKKFLESERFNPRTDDDKTLVLAWKDGTAP